MSSSVIEGAIKVLVEFEAELDRIREEAAEAKKALLKIATDEGEKARMEAIAKAQEIAEDRITMAREAAEREASSILREGDEALANLKQTISNRRHEAVDLVVRLLLGD